MNPQATEASFLGIARLKGLLEASLLLGLLAAAVLLAIVALPSEPPGGAPGDEAPREGLDALVVPAATNLHLLVLVESDDRATALHGWRDLHLLLDSHSFATVEFVGPIGGAALDEALTFANVACPYEGCAPVAVLDLRAPGLP